MTNPAPSPLRSAAGLFLWAWTPFRPLAAAELYGLLATRAFTAEGTRAEPRPRRRSGWLTTPTSSWPAATSASRLGTA
jgi:hypothetical protein